MADEDKNKTTPTVNEILKALGNKTPLGGKRTEFALPKPMILGTMLPKPNASGRPDFGVKDVKDMLNNLGLQTLGQRRSNTGQDYIVYDDPVNPTMPGQIKPEIRIPGKTGKLHSGSPRGTQSAFDAESAPLKFFDTAGTISGDTVPTGFYDKFQRNAQGDYYNKLKVLENALIYAHGKGLVPPGTEPRKIETPLQPVVKLPSDPNQLDFMDKLYANHGTQRLDNIAGGNPENLLSSNQMKQRFNLDTTKDFGMGMLPSVRRGQNESPPLLPGGNTGIQGTFNEKYIQLMRLLEKSKEPPPDAGQ